MHHAEHPCFHIWHFTTWQGHPCKTTSWHHAVLSHLAFHYICNLFVHISLLQPSPLLTNITFILDLNVFLWPSSSIMRKNCKTISHLCIQCKAAFEPVVQIRVHNPVAVNVGDYMKEALDGLGPWKYLLKCSYKPTIQCDDACWNICIQIFKWDMMTLQWNTAC